MSDLIGEPVEVGLFPPFYTDCGKNIHLGKGVFINAGCKFQDQGGIFISDGALIGHNTVLATLNHGLLPEERHDLIPKPIHIGKNVWIRKGAVRAESRTFYALESARQYEFTGEICA